MKHVTKHLALLVALATTACQVNQLSTPPAPSSRSLLSTTTKQPHKARAHRRVKDGLPINYSRLQKKPRAKQHRTAAKSGLWSRFHRSEMPENSRNYTLKSDGGLGNADHFRSVTLPDPGTLPSADPNGIVLDIYAQHQVPWSGTTSTPAYFLPDSTVTDRIVFAPTLSGPHNCPVEITSVYALPKRELADPEHPELGYSVAIQEQFVGAWDHSLEYTPGVPNWVEETKLPMDQSFGDTYLYEINDKYYYDAEIILDDEGYWVGGIYNLTTDELDPLLITNSARYTTHVTGWTAYEAYFSSNAPSPPPSGIEVPYFEAIGCPIPTNTNDSGDNNDDYYQFLTWDVQPVTNISFITGWKVDAN